MSCTKGKWEIISRKDDSYDKPYFEHHIISYPYGIEAGPQRVCNGLSKFDARRICQCVNSHEALLEACENFREWWANHFEDFDKKSNGELLCLDNDCEVAIAQAKEQGK